MFLKIVLMALASLMTSQVYAAYEVSTLNQTYSALEIYRAVEQAKKSGERQIVFNPPTKNLVNQVSLQNESSPADFVFLVGGLLAEDEELRLGMFQAIYPTLQSAALVRMRAIVNLAATTDDLKQVLQTQRPTFLIWVAHGSEDGYAYDASMAPIDKNIYKNMSPYIYHYVHVSCFGEMALKNYKFRATHLKVFPGLTMATDLAVYLNRDANLLKGRPGVMTNNGFSCESTPQGYRIVNAGGLVMPLDDATQFGPYNCALMLYSMSENMMCVHTKYGYDIASTLTGKILKGVNYTESQGDLYKCASKLRGARDGKVCRRLGKNSDVFGWISAKDGLPVPGVSFKSLDQCKIELSASVEI